MQRHLQWARFATIAVLALPLAVGACQPEDDADGGSATGVDAPSAMGAPEPVTYVASDFAFEGPDTLPAGWTTIRLRNEGEEIHHLNMVKLDDGKTLSDVEAYLASGDMEPPDWVMDYGGPNGAIGPVEPVATIKLDEGNYVAVCTIPSPDGVMHLAKGMFKEVTVTGDNGAAPPVADVSLDLGDFVFVHGDPYTAGKHTIEVTNTGGQPHEVVFVRLDEGKTAADFAAAFAPGAPPGPPPGMPVGGLTPISQGQVAYAEVEFAPGNHAALCFLTDPATGQVHVDLGMSEEFTVQ